MNGVYQFECAGRMVSAQQHPDAFDFFNRFLAEHKFERIIEIGTAAGGLAWWFWHNHKIPMTTYDIAVRQLHGDLHKAGVDVVHGDVFSPLHRADIEKLISEPGKTLLLCDGGNKIAEFNYFSSFLKSGDVIMAHDYSADEGTYNNRTKQKWFWWEIRWSDVAAVCKALSLFCPDKSSEDALWLCMQKR